jgi:hypothetical protein
MNGVCCWECARTSGAEHNETCLVMRERKRAAGILRNMIRYACAVGTTRDECIIFMETALIGLNPEEGKVSLSREQEIADIVAEAVTLERERCSIAADAAIEILKSRSPTYILRVMSELDKIRSGQ